VNGAAGFESAPAAGHVESVDDEIGAVVVGHGVADDLAVARSCQQARQSQPSAVGR
jgi:hypothetical protein